MSSVNLFIISKLIASDGNTIACCHPARVSLELSNIKTQTVNMSKQHFVIGKQATYTCVLY